MARRKKRKKKNGIRLYKVIIIVCAIVTAYFVPALKGGSEALKQLFPSGNETEQVELVHQETSDKNDAATNRLEMPSPLKNSAEQIMYKTAYTVSYNKKMKIPNWVAWELTPERLVERESRTNEFLPDPELPTDEAVTTNDYKGSGYDRGHMCPAGDNKYRYRAMMESFYMTNMCPQIHSLNSGDWKELEEKCRTWAKREGKIYIVCGPILYKQKHKTIGRKQQVVVPEAFFKVVLAMNKKPKAIGFIYKNEKTNRPMRSYVNSIDQVERITGIDFFPNLPDDVERKVEAACNLDDWN